MPRSKVGDFIGSTKDELIKQLNNALEIANLGVYEWDIVNNHLQFDDHVYLMTGIDRNAFDHTMGYIVKHVIHPESTEQFVNSISLSESVTGEDQRLNDLHIAYRINHPNKELCYLEFMSRVIYQDGTPIKLIGVMMEVTDRVEREKEFEESILFIQSLLESIPSPMFYKNKDAIYKNFNQAFQDYIGLSYEAIKDKTVYDVAPKHLAAIYEEADQRLLRQGGKQVYESEVIDEQGRRKYVVFHKAVHKNSRGESDGLIGLIQDVTVVREREIYLKRISDAQQLLVKFNQEMFNYSSEHRYFKDMMLEFRKLFPQVKASILLEIDKDGILSIYDSKDIVLLSKDLDMVFSESLLFELINEEYSKVHLIGEIDPSIMMSGDMGKAILEENPFKSTIMIPIEKDGNLRWMFGYSSFMEGDFTENDLALAEFMRAEMHVLIDVYKLYEKTVQMARYDGLTGLMNRVYFDESFRSKLMSDTFDDFVVVIVDLDDLKAINDRFGHDIGDLYISRLATIMKSYFIHEGFFGRIGGDEFAGVISMDEKEIITLLEDVNIEFKKSIEDLVGEPIGGFSYGLSSTVSDGLTYKKLLKAADQRMYNQKKRKKKPPE